MWRPQSIQSYSHLAQRCMAPSRPRTPLASRALSRNFSPAHRPSRPTSAPPKTSQRVNTKQRSIFSSLRRPFSATRSQCNRQAAQRIAEPDPQSLSARLRKLSREYGWSAIGIYMALSALDFPFCFLAVRWLGTERIGVWEHAIVEWVKRAIPIQWPRKAPEASTAEGDMEAINIAPVGYDHGVLEAERQNLGENASVWTQLALAYAIHKSFIFIRVPATVAVTPKVVKILRGWGWNIGKRTPKAEREARKIELATRKAAGK